MSFGQKSKKGLSKIIKNFGRATGEAFKLVGSRDFSQVFEGVQKVKVKPKYLLC